MRYSLEGDLLRVDAAQLFELLLSEQVDFLLLAALAVVHDAGVPHLLFLAQFHLYLFIFNLIIYI